MPNTANAVPILDGRVTKFAAISVFDLVRWSSYGGGMAETTPKSEIVNVHDAKTNLSKLLARVEAGEQITIGRAGKPIARLVPMQEVKRSGVFGCMSWLPPLPDDFNDPDPEIEEIFGMR